MGQILRNEHYHSALVSLSAKMIANGLNVRSVIYALRELMTEAPMSGRLPHWQGAYDDIKRTVRSAREKFEPKSKPNGEHKTRKNGADESWYDESAADFEARRQSRHDDEPPPHPGDDRPPKFRPVLVEDLKFSTAEEWRVKKLLPRRGVAAIYGPSQAFKSFVAIDLLLSVALGWPWALRRSYQAPTVYIAAEGAGGLRKRIAGWMVHNDGHLHDKVPCSVIEVAPNLGTGNKDLMELIAGIEAVGILPGIIAIDTLAQSLGGGEENSGGMVTFVANATALAAHFNCLVIIVHHVGLADDQRLRGHTSLIGALDVSILSERKEGELSTALTVKKQKDEENDQRFTASLKRIVLGDDEEGEEVATLMTRASLTRRRRTAPCP